MKRYQCGDFGWPGQRPWAPPGCCPPPCPPPCPPGQTPCPPAQDPCPPQEPCVSGCVPTPWVLGGCYRAGQLVTYNGYLYVANRDNAAGTPGSSADFTLLSTLQPVGPTGPAGVPGPTGPTEAGKMDNNLKKREKNGNFGALLVQNIPYNIQTVYRGQWPLINMDFLGR